MRNRPQSLHIDDGADLAVLDQVKVAHTDLPPSIQMPAKEKL
jgi:hypothetical protein